MIRPSSVSRRRDKSTAYAFLFLLVWSDVAIAKLKDHWPANKQSKHKTQLTGPSKMLETVKAAQVSQASTS